MPDSNQQARVNINKDGGATTTNRSIQMDNNGMDIQASNTSGGTQDSTNIALLN